MNSDFDVEIVNGVYDSLEQRGCGQLSTLVAK
jgi:hypothetical protein